MKACAPGCDYFTVFYSFLCLGSCQGGLARRPISLIFSLETATGAVLGRRVMEVRICSCPIRDMKQEEEKLERGSGRAGQQKAGPEYGSRGKVGAEQSSRGASPAKRKQEQLIYREEEVS